MPKSNKWFWLLFILIIVLGFFLRFYQLDMKLLHHDEAVLYQSFVQPILNNQCPYWPPDFHSNLPHYITAPFVQLFGISAFSLRFASALFGSLTIILLFLLKDQIGKTGVLVSSAFLAVSPIFVFYSRQYTGYPFYDFFLLLFLIFLIKIIKKYDIFSFYALFILGGLILSINEAFLIFLFILFGFIFLLYLFNMQDFSKLKLIDIQDVIIGLILGIIIFLAVHTCLFTNMVNFQNLINVFTVFAEKSIKIRHLHPFSYYFTIIIPIEIGLLIMMVAGLFSFRKDLFSRFIVFWSLSSLLIFSFIGYKTNWILSIILFPLILLSGETANNLIGKYKMLRKIIIPIILILLAVTLYFCITQNFFIYNSSVENRIGYIETSQGIIPLIDDVNEYAEGKNISIFYTIIRSNPLPYYLGKYPYGVHQQSTKINVSAYPYFDVFVGSVDQFIEIPDNFTKKQYDFKQKPFVEKVEVLFRNQK